MQQITTSSIQSPTLQSTITKHHYRNLSCILFIASISLFVTLSFISSPNATYPSASSSLSSSSSSSAFLLQNHHKKLLHLHSSSSSPPEPPSVAYFISGSDGDADRLLRLLYSLYHPGNQYLLHLDLTAGQSQRDYLALSVQSVPIFGSFQNVNVIGKANFANPRGSSAVSATLHGAAILLRYSRNWDWFINLSAEHYPLVTQDDLLHILSFQPKDLNFVNHSSYIGWRESWRLKPIIVDPGLYLSEKRDIFYATQKRLLPNSYRLFTGSPSSILSRKFVEFCILGSDNLPRTVLMYFSNTPSSQANYFQTVMCNSREFRKTIINHNLHYSSRNDIPNREQRKLGPDDFNDIIQSGAAFASEFALDDPVLDRIDREILNRKPGKITPGGWCLGEDDEDPCTVRGDSAILRPGPGARRLEKRMIELLSNETLLSQRCIYE